MQPQQEIEDTEETVDNELAVTRKKKVSCFERIFSIVFKKKPPIDLNKQNEKLLELLKPIRYKPDTVEQMAWRQNEPHEGGYRCVGRRHEPCAQPNAV